MAPVVPEPWDFVETTKEQSFFIQLRFTVMRLVRCMQFMSHGVRSHSPTTTTTLRRSIKCDMYTTSLEPLSGQ